MTFDLKRGISRRWLFLKLHEEADFAMCVKMQGGNSLWYTFRFNNLVFTVPAWISIVKIVGVSLWLLITSSSICNFGSCAVSFVPIVEK